MKLVLLFDFDGTLSPIVRHPDKARLPASIKKQLMKMTRQSSLVVGIVSGRDLKSVRKKVGIGSFIYAGNHGYEIQFPKKKVMVHPAAKKTKPAIEHICKELIKKMGNGYKGVWVENKTWSASLHTRMATPAIEKKAHGVFNAVVRPYVKKKKIKITKGKKVLECRPPAKWDKGKAVQYILSKIKTPGLPIYVGDDRTDEDAFRVLKKRGVGIKVGGSKPTAAMYSIKSVKQMPIFLKMIRTVWAPKN